MKYNNPLIILILLIFSFSGKSNGLYFHNITEGHGLSNRGFKTICEDENGFVWFGGPSGLYYHNTHRIEKIELPTDSTELSEFVEVNHLYKDHNKNIWICTKGGLYLASKADGRIQKQHTYVQKNDSIFTNDFRNIVQIDKTQYLVLNSYKLYVYNTQNDSFEMLNYNFKQGITHLSEGDTNTIYIGTARGKVYEVKNKLKDIKLLFNQQNDRLSSVCKVAGKYYLGFLSSGLIIINSDGKIIRQLNSQSKGQDFIKNNLIRSLLKQDNGSIWIGTNEGIYILDGNNLSLLDSRFETGLPHRQINCLSGGLNGKIWLSTYGGSVAFYSPNNYKFKYIQLDYPQAQLESGHVSCITEDSQGRIWIGSEDEGSIKIYDPKQNTFIQGQTLETLSKLKNLKCLTNISSSQMALFSSASNTISIYNYEKHHLEQNIELPVRIYPGLRSAQVFNEKLWLSTPLDLLAIDLNTKQVVKHLKPDARIWSFYFDSSHRLWLATTRGLYTLKPSSNEFEPCPSQAYSEIINEASIFSVCEDKDGHIWVGTTGHGTYLYYPEEQTTTLAPGHDLSGNSDIYNMLRDQHNNIWYVSNKGLFQYNSSTQRSYFHGTNNGTINAQIRLNSTFLSHDGKLYLGAKSGFSTISPSSIKYNETKPDVFLSDFKVNNQNYLKYSESYGVSAGLKHLKRVKLKAKENTLLFGVVCNNYINSERNTFKYRLLNYDDEWLTIPQGKDIVFTKIPPGKYTFEAYGANNNQVWSNTPYQLDIQILHPLYLRWYALLLYVFIISFIVVWLYFDVKTKLKLRKEIEETQNKARVNEMIHSERVKLFTNISHELRTPLSLIVSPLSYIMNKKEVDPETKQLLETIDRNAKQLQKTADQTIDFRLLETGQLEPSFRFTDIIQLAKNVFHCFEQAFIDKEIKGVFLSDFKSLEIYGDGDMIEKVIYNLMSNALKYTPKDGNISLIIKQKDFAMSDFTEVINTGERFEGKGICIQVADSGAGISSDFLPHIFKRFSKGDQPHEHSTGIGLHLCSEYAAMNHANLQVESSEGEGSCFSLCLPLKDNAKLEKSELSDLVKAQASKTVSAGLLSKAKNPHLSSILIAEDNGELRDFLKTLLSENYKVITAKNGVQALAQIKHIVPDLILTDVAMPEMDGLELIKHLKEDDNTKYIPIIVMTAYADRQYQMESISCGAKAFFTKPIDPDLLQAQIENTLSEKQHQVMEEVADARPSKEESFIEKAERIVEKNLQSVDFQIEDLYQELGIGKTTLTRKLKQETGLNPSGFIREIRLNKARTLLSNQSFSIEEIATFVGFKYTTYFVKSFKDKYGITPSEYRKQALKVQ